jgi:phosphopantetheinyl transferase
MKWSGQQDSNLRPSAPKADALPGCAIPRHRINGALIARLDGMGKSLIELLTKSMCLSSAIGMNDESHDPYRAILSADIPQNPEKDWAFWLVEADWRALAEIHHPAIRRRRIAGRAVLRALLWQRLGNLSGDLSLHYDSLGRPVVGGKELFISVSYAGNQLFASASGIGPIGIDAEIVREFADMPASRDYICAPAEKGWLLSLPYDQSIEMFYLLWTLKEASLKAQGVGLRREPSSLCFNCPLHPPYISSELMSYGSLRIGDVRLSLASAHQTGLSLDLIVRDITADMTKN